MSETEEEVIVEEEVEEEVEVIKIDAIPMGSGAHLRKKEFTNPALRREIIKLRQDSNSWESIARRIQKEFGCSISPMTTRKIYDEEIAKSIVVSPKAKQSYSKYNDLIEKNYGELQKLMDWWVSTLHRIKDDIVTDEIMVNPTEFVKFIKITESIEKGNRSILEQLKFIKGETDRVKMETKNFIFSPQQINQKIIEFRKSENVNLGDEREKIEKDKKELERDRKLFETRKISLLKGGKK